MTETTTRRLGFGYNQGLPEGVTAAWGCRMIVGQDGYTDYLANRSDRFGDDEDLAALFAWLDGDKAMAKARANAEELLKAYEMRTRTAAHFVLYEDEKGAVVGNTNASAGYLYVAAYLKEAIA